jgi:hypothetical protein
VVSAHSQVLLARWEYYRLLQRNISAGMTGGGSAGEVDVSEHSADSMQLVLQHLYTGRVQLSLQKVAGNRAKAGEASAGGSGNPEPKQTAAAGGSTASRKRDAQGETKNRTGEASESLCAHSAAAAAASSVADSSQLLAVLRAADALLLPDLRDECLRHTQRQLSPENALPLLLAAHEAQLELLQKVVMAYVVKDIRGEGEVTCLP